MVWEDQPAARTIVMIVVHTSLYSAGCSSKSVWYARTFAILHNSSLCVVPGWLFISPFVGRVCVQAGVGADFRLADCLPL